MEGQWLDRFPVQRDNNFDWVLRCSEHKIPQNGVEPKHDNQTDKEAQWRDPCLGQNGTNDGSQDNGDDAGPVHRLCLVANHRRALSDDEVVGDNDAGKSRRGYAQDAKETGQPWAHPEQRRNDSKAL